MPDFGGVQKIVDRVNEVLAAVAKLTKSDVLVGIPADKAGRPGSPINNATLGYIHNYGSPARGIPPRPFLTQGIRKVRPQIIPLLRNAGIDALQGKNPVPALHRVGMMARNAVVSEITDPEPPFRPLQPATIRARLRRTQAGRRQLRKLQASAQAAGQSTAQALLDWAGQGNIRPLIDTAQLRSSISYVVRE